MFGRVISEASVQMELSVVYIREIQEVQRGRKEYTEPTHF